MATVRELQEEDIRLLQRIEALRAALRSAKAAVTTALDEDYAPTARVILKAVPRKIEDALLEDDERGGLVF